MSSALPRRRLVGRAIGRVQGVGYRAFCVDEATRMQIAGYARNLGDGRTVEVVAESDEPTLRRFVERLREGPTLAIVDDVDYRWEDAEDDLVGFEARF
ncbi:MAG: acylphosphatase [Chloroflexi bacterium]|nr:acylphosphatase [Chloroflexota bacterium]